MSKIQINFDDLQDFAIQLGKAANKCDEALGHINVDLYSLLANIPGVASKNIHELETIFESNLKKYKKNLVKAQHLMRITEAIMSETERKLARKAREIAEENARIFSTLQMVDKHVWMPQINGRDEHDSSTKLTDEQIKGLRNYIRQLKNGEIDSNLDTFRAMPEDNTWQGNIYPSNPGVKPEVDDVTKALGKFAFDFLVGDVVTILDPDALTEDKLIAAAMMLPPAKVVKLAAKLKDLEKMKDSIDNLDDVSKKTGNNLKEAKFTKGQLVTRPKYAPILEKWEKKGGEVKIDEKGIWIYTNKKGQSVSYPGGYPDFSLYSHPTIKPVEIQVTKPTNRSLDYKLANEKAGLSKDSDPAVPSLDKPPVGFTWHHHEDGKTMILVDKKVHSQFSHMGGVHTVNGE